MDLSSAWAGEQTANSCRFQEVLLGSYKEDLLLVLSLAGALQATVLTLVLYVCFHYSIVALAWVCVLVVSLFSFH